MGANCMQGRVTCQLARVRPSARVSSSDVTLLVASGQEGRLCWSAPPAGF